MRLGPLEALHDFALTAAVRRQGMGFASYALLNWLDRNVDPTYEAGERLKLARRRYSPSGSPDEALQRSRAGLCVGFFRNVKTSLTLLKSSIAHVCPFKSRFSNFSITATWCQLGVIGVEEPPNSGALIGLLLPTAFSFNLYGENRTFLAISAVSPVINDKN